MAAPQFAALLQLQDLDTSIGQQEHRLSHLPEAQVVADLDAAIAAVTARRASLTATLDEVAQRQSAAERELAATEARIRTVSDRLFGGTVTAGRELQAMTADVESLKTRASSLEDRVLEVLDERAPLDGAIAAADEELAVLADRRRAAEEAMTSAGGDVAAALAANRDRRGALAGSVPGALLADYERIRARSGGMGAARLVGDRCAGCHLTLPSVELDRVRHAAPDAVQYCDECGRILVRP